jgi:peptidoglycan/xylan/chitin deacetylase (PgdA/CDA1 family)
LQEYAAVIKGSNLLRRAAPYIPTAVLKPFGRPVALFFHGLTDRIRDPRIEINHHTLDRFCAIAVQLQREFQVLPLSALDDALKNPQRHTRTVFLMSDDGYANTLFAADVLDALRLPWALFVSTEHIESGELNPLILARMFVHFAPEGEYALPHLQGKVTLRSVKDRTRVAPSLLESLKRLPVAKARACITAIKNTFPAGQLESLRAEFPTERYLSWAEVESLHRRGVEIGAHAHWHWPMNGHQSEDELLLQANLPRKAIESRVGRCHYFSYPFGNEGDVSPAARKAVRDAGYSHAFTTLSGTLRSGVDPWLLPRYALKSDEPNLSALVPLLRLGDARVARLTSKLAGQMRCISSPR